MASIHKRPSGWYQLVDRPNQYTKTLKGLTEKQAEDYLKVYEAKILMGAAGFADATKKYDEFKQETLKYYKDRTPKGEDGSTYQKYLYAFRSLEAYRKPLYLAEVKIKTVEEWQVHCLKPAEPKTKEGQEKPTAPEGGWGQGLHPTTVYMNYRHLKSAWNRAIVKKQIVENPFTKADAPVVEEHEKRHLTDDEVNKLLTTARASEVEDGELMAAVFVGTGIRRQELTHMIWPYMNLDTGELYIRSWDKLKDKPYWDGFTVKKHEARTVYLPEELLPALRIKKAVSTSDLVFPSPKTGGVRDEGALDRMFNKFYKRARIPEAKGVHILRHTFGFRKGAVTDAKTLQELLGHKNIKTTQIYMHTNEQRKRDAVNAGTKLQIGGEQGQAKEAGLTVV
jgi:integrase